MYVKSIFRAIMQFLIFFFFKQSSPIYGSLKVKLFVQMSKLGNHIDALDWSSSYNCYRILH